MSCSPAARTPLHCPSLPEVIAQLLALLPSGRAWQSGEGGPTPYRDAPFDPATFDSEAFDTDSRPGTILYRYWAAVAEPIWFAASRLCALRREFFCATQSETNDLWMAEYGLPDPCDPFPDLCTKVAALGGTRCEYFAEIAARAGWSIECEDYIQDCGDVAGGAEASCAQVGGRGPVCKLQIIVHLNESPSFTGILDTPPLAGLLCAGADLGCDPAIAPLQCLLDRVVPAHIEIIYLTIED